MNDTGHSADHDPVTIEVAPGMAMLFNGLAIGAVTVASLLPLGTVVYWLLVDAAAVRQMTGLAPDLLPDIIMSQRIGAAFVALLSVLPMAWGLARLRTCLASFAAGRPFASDGIAGLRDFAVGGLLAALAKLVGNTLMGLVLTWTAAEGHKQLIIRLDSDMLLLAMFAGTIAALAWAMEKAAAIAEENSQFV
jgi:hypothetical protein